MFYRLFRMLATIALRLYFRRIDVEGLDHLPTSGPLLLVPNHANSLVDPLLPITALNRKITLTAKSSLSKNPLLALLMWGLDAVMFHRAQDIGKGANPRENIRSLQRCREILARGGAVCIFPEGISHSDLQMREFHTGPARIALDYVRKDGNPGRLKIVPMGLLYAHKDRFRSDAWMRLGEPVDVADWLSAHPDAGADELTQDLRRWIDALTVSYQTRREFLIVNYASDLVATQARMPRPLGSTLPSAADSFRRLNALIAGYRELTRTHPAQVADLESRIRAYRAKLKLHRITPHEVFLSLSPWRAILFLIRELELIVIGAPIALFGLLNHVIPVAIVRTLAVKLSSDKDHWATNVIYPSFVIFPIAYIIQFAAAFCFLPTIWAFAYLLILPYSGYYVLLYRDRAAAAWRRARTFWYFVRHPGSRQSLAAEGSAILADIDTLAQALPAVQPEHSNGSDRVL